MYHYTDFAEYEVIYLITAMILPVKEYNGKEIRDILSAGEEVEYVVAK